MIRFLLWKVCASGSMIQGIGESDGLVTSTKASTAPSFMKDQKATKANKTRILKETKHRD